MKTGRSVCETYPPVDALTQAGRPTAGGLGEAQPRGPWVRWQVRKVAGKDALERGPVRIGPGLYNRAPLWRTIVRKLSKLLFGLSLRF